MSSSQDMKRGQVYEGVAAGWQTARSKHWTLKMVASWWTKEKKQDDENVDEFRGSGYDSSRAESEGSISASIVHQNALVQRSVLGIYQKQNFKFANIEDVTKIGVST
jgi:hypothetical protein